MPPDPARFPSRPGPSAAQTTALASVSASATPTATASPVPPSYRQDQGSPSSSATDPQHRKDTPERSRTGCVQCRSAKKKCTEERPTCARCAQRRVTCTYDREIGVRHRNKRRRPLELDLELDLKPGRERGQSTPTTTISNSGSHILLAHTTTTAAGGRTASPTVSAQHHHPYSHSSYPPPPAPPTTSYSAHRHLRQQEGDLRTPSGPSFISTTAAIKSAASDDPTALLSPSAELRSWIEGGNGTNVPIPVAVNDSAPLPAAMQPAVTDYGIGAIDTSSNGISNSNSDPAASGFNMDQMLVEHLLQEFFSTSSSDITDLFPSLLNSANSDSTPCTNYDCTKFITDPATVRRRLEQSHSPGPTWPISCYVPASFPTSATKEELDLVRHFIEIQSPISIAVESEHNPLRKHILPVALQIAPLPDTDTAVAMASTKTSPSEIENTPTPGTGANGDTNANPIHSITSSTTTTTTTTTTAPERDNPAFHALLAAAATHRANLFVAAGKEEDPALRRSASRSRAKGYSLVGEAMDSYPSAENEKREQIDCAMLLLTYTAVIDGNSKLLPILYESYHRVLSLTDYSILSSRSRAFINMCAVYEVWYEFATLATGGEPLKPLLELFPPSDRFVEPHLDGMFGVPGFVCSRWYEAINLVKKYQKAKRDGNPSMLIPICLQAEELDESIAMDQRTRLSTSANSSIQLGTAGSADRIRQGVEIHYATLRVFVQKEILGIRTEEDCIQRQIKMALGILSTIRWGTETGLLIPLFILSINALPSGVNSDREVFRAFLSRCCWKGSAGPRTVAAAVQEIWDRSNNGIGHGHGLEDDWRAVLLKYGGPILI